MSTVKKLVEVLELERLEKNLFRGESRDIGTPNVFGGQVLAQGLSAATKTVDSERLVHSLHAYFILPGDVKAPIVYEVDPIRDGGSFTTRRVIAIQHGRPIFNMAASFHKAEDGVEHQAEMPKVKMPDEIPDLRELITEVPKGMPEVIRRYFTEEQPIEFRPVELENPFSPVKRSPINHIWFRTTQELPNIQSLHRTILAYVSDFNLLGTAMRPHAISSMKSGVRIASLDHALWFHRDFKMDDWLLYALDSPSAGSSRGFSRGSVFTKEGILVASVAQEGLMRIS
ncbi:MAG: acyl-CoA thioesterase-2 [Limisphaerales bacterium]|jgi:acyl-CoA thioesterase-2